MTNLGTLYSKTHYVADRTNNFDAISLKGKQQNLHAWETALLSARASVQNNAARGNPTSTALRVPNPVEKNCQGVGCSAPRVAESWASSTPVAFGSDKYLFSRAPIVFTQLSATTPSILMCSAYASMQPSLSQVAPASKSYVASAAVAGILVPESQYKSLCRVPNVHLLYTEPV